MLEILEQKEEKIYIKILEKLNLEERRVNLQERAVRIEEELKGQRVLIEKLLHQFDKRFEQVDKRFEQMHGDMESRFQQWFFGRPGFKASCQRGSLLAGGHGMLPQYSGYGNSTCPYCGC